MLFLIMPTSTHWEFERFEGWYPVFSVGRSVEFILERNECGMWKKMVGWIEGECGTVEVAEQGAERAGPELEIHASLFGYNLTWPTPCVRIVVAFFDFRIEIKSRVLWELWKTWSLRSVFQALVEIAKRFPQRVSFHRTELRKGVGQIGSGSELS